MILRFRETFALPIGEVFSYFETPSDWARLYGFAGQAPACRVIGQEDAAGVDQHRHRNFLCEHSHSAAGRARANPQPA